MYYLLQNPCITCLEFGLYLDPLKMPRFSKVGCTEEYESTEKSLQESGKGTQSLPQYEPLSIEEYVCIHVQVQQLCTWFYICI